MSSVLTRRLLYWSLGLSSLAIGLVYYRFNPAQEAFFPVCVFRKVTGLHCPGCGAQRALHALLHGRFGEAFHNNALLMLALPYALLGFVLDLRNYLRGHGELPAAYRRQEVILAIFALICLFWILRNVPGLPFEWLAPVE
ncbi:MAG: DUF2752 domain-containing protein [Sphingobacteriaceae bacterium]|nr:DUF2752 domain-containing protein [Cytophagaceae bacterium]